MVYDDKRHEIKIQLIEMVKMFRRITALGLNESKVACEIFIKSLGYSDKSIIFSPSAQDEFMRFCSFAGKFAQGEWEVDVPNSMIKKVNINPYVDDTEIRMLT